MLKVNHLTGFGVSFSSQFSALPGSLFGTGSNGDGELGLDNDKADVAVFTQEASLDDNWTDVTCGSNFSVSVKTDGTLWGTGNNSQGELGLNDNTDVEVFTQEDGSDTDWATVSAGLLHTVAIKEAGTDTLWGTGDNQQGQLGIGTNSNVNVFTQETSLKSWSQVSCGALHTMAIDTAGALWGTGLNESGQLGIGNETNQNTFVQESSGVTTWVAVACGSFHTIALRSDNTLWAAGRNTFGALGNNTTTKQDDFVQETTLRTDWVEIGAGDFHSNAITSGNTLYATGDNRKGQLGTGDTSQQEEFTIEINQDANWMLVTGGLAYTMAIKTTMSLWGTGDNSTGQLGLGADTQDKLEFTNTVGSNQWQDVGAGNAHTMAITS